MGQPLQKSARSKSGAGGYIRQTFAMEYEALFDGGQVKQMHMFTLLSAIMGGLRPQIPDDCPPSLARTMCRCWASDPEER